MSKSKKFTEQEELNLIKMLNSFDYDQIQLVKNLVVTRTKSLHNLTHILKKYGLDKIGFGRVKNYEWACADCYKRMQQKHKSAQIYYPSGNNVYREIKDEDDIFEHFIRIQDKKALLLGVLPTKNKTNLQLWGGIDYSKNRDYRDDTWFDIENLNLSMYEFAAFELIETQVKHLESYPNSMEAFCVLRGNLNLETIPNFPSELWFLQIGVAPKLKSLPPLPTELQCLYLSQNKYLSEYVLDNKMITKNHKCTDPEIGSLKLAVSQERWDKYCEENDLPKSKINS